MGEGWPPSRKTGPALCASPQPPQAPRPLGRRVVAVVAARPRRPQVPTQHGGWGERSLPLATTLAAPGLAGGLPSGLAAGLFPTPPPPPGVVAG